MYYYIVQLESVTETMMLLSEQAKLNNARMNTDKTKVVLSTDKNDYPVFSAYTPYSKTDILTEMQNADWK